MLNSNNYYRIGKKDYESGTIYEVVEVGENRTKYNVKHFAKAHEAEAYACKRAIVTGRLQVVDKVAPNWRAVSVISRGNNAFEVYHNGVRRTVIA